MREAKLEQCLKKIISSGLEISDIVDVGVQHETPILKKLFPKKNHILFEPVQEYYKFIHKNYQNITYTLVEAAVSDIDGETILHTERKTRGDEISHSMIVDKETVSSRRVKCFSLDRYFKDFASERPYLLKIDVEGADIPSKIIQGGKSFIGNCSVIIIEMTVDKMLERSSLLHELGFDVFDICDLCYYGDTLWQADFIFIERSLKYSNLALSPMHQRPFQPEIWQKGFDQ